MKIRGTKSNDHRTESYVNTFENKNVVSVRSGKVAYQGKSSFTKSNNLDDSNTDQADIEGLIPLLNKVLKKRHSKAQGHQFSHRFLLM